MSRTLRSLLVVCAATFATPALAGPPACTAELRGVIWEFGSPTASDLRQCDGAQYVPWVPPLSACPPPLPPVASPGTQPISTTGQPSPAPVGTAPPPIGTAPPPLPTGPATTLTKSKVDCESTCRGLYHRCVTSKCGGLGGQCKQDCARSQARCNTTCPSQ